MYIGNTFYKYYPKIREEDIGIDTSNKFIDTLQLSNLYLPGIGGDRSTVTWSSLWSLTTVM